MLHIFYHFIILGESKSTGEFVNNMNLLRLWLIQMHTLLEMEELNDLFAFSAMPFNAQKWLGVNGEVVVLVPRRRGGGVDAAP